MAGIRVGEVTHFFDRLSVAVLKLTEPIRLGDTLHLLGHHTDFRQKLESMQIEHQEVTEARPGQDVAVKLAQKVHPAIRSSKSAGRGDFNQYVDKLSWLAASARNAGARCMIFALDLNGGAIHRL